MKELRMYQVDSYGKVTLGVGSAPKYVSGINRLIQIVIFYILQNPGRSVLSPQSGSGLRALIGTTNLEGEQELHAEVTLSVSKMQQDIIDLQATTADPPDEKLAQIVIVSIKASGDDSAELTLRVINQAGDSRTLTV